MKKTTKLCAVMLFAAITLFTAGCYTVISTAAYRGAGGVAPDRSSYDRVSTSEQAAAETDSTAEQNESPDFGLKLQAYDSDTSESEYEDGETVVNNYYYYNNLDPYYYSGGYQPWYGRSWYNPWFRGYGYPGVSLGFGYDSYLWYEPWYGSLDWYWTDPWCQYDPWYRYSWCHTPYGGWYGGWGNDRWNDRYPGDWQHNGGGGYDGGDIANEPRKYRQDRLAGFGTSRNTGGVVTAGSGSSGNNYPENGVSERAVRGDARTGFGTANTRRGSQKDAGSGTEKRNAVSPAPNVRTPSSKETAPNAGTIHQKVRSGEMTRRNSAPEQENGKISSDAVSGPVLGQGDERYRMNDRTEIVIKRDVPPDITGKNAASEQQQNSADSERSLTLSSALTMNRRNENATAARSGQVQESPSPEKPAVRPATQERASGERSTSYTPPSSRTEPSGNSRSSYSPPSSGSRPSYSPPSSGGSRSSGSSGGSQSRPSNSRSGSRRR